MVVKYLCSMVIVLFLKYLQCCIVAASTHRVTVYVGVVSRKIGRGSLRATSQSELSTLRSRSVAAVNLKVVRRILLPDPSGSPRSPRVPSCHNWAASIKVCTTYRFMLTVQVSVVPRCQARWENLLRTLKFIVLFPCSWPLLTAFITCDPSFEGDLYHMAGRLRGAHIRISSHRHLPLQCLHRPGVLE